MTFDEAFKSEAEKLFDDRADLEIFDGKQWTWLANQPMRDDIFSDKNRACQLASSMGCRLSGGMAVRFKIKGV